MTLKKNDYWETPKYFFNILDDMFEFTLDPCATPETAKCEKYFTEEDDGLSKSWEGETVFCNPPFSKMSEWSEKCATESKHATIVMLCPPRTDTKYWHNWIMKADEIWFCKGRVNFLMDGVLHKRTRDPMCVIVFGTKYMKETKTDYPLMCGVKWEKLIKYFGSRSPLLRSLKHKEHMNSDKVSDDEIL